ncbi:MAG: transposase [Patescibacteria group bacterium]|nr:transposase [Patescibacteria group bacterium]
MPAKNSIKTYQENSYYHLYNRGVEKRPIFQDDQDYIVFLSYIKEYLLPKDENALKNKLADPNTSYKEKDKILRALRLNNFHDEIELIAYCLMPNHFHFLVRQKSTISIDRFMNSLGIRYAMYFNRKYTRVGALFQDVYKAVLVESDPQLLNLSRYIHRNPISNSTKSKSASQVDVLCAYFSQPSSLPEYLGQRKTEWIHPEEILSYFSKTNPQLSYQAFIEEANDLTLLQNLAVDL